MITLMFCLVLFNVSAYTDQLQINISIQVTNTSIQVYNKELGTQTQTLNFSNATRYTINYTWQKNHEYNLNGSNCTIFNYTTIIQECDNSELKNIRNMIDDCNQSKHEAKIYFDLYQKCFVNHTNCKSYKNNNEEYKGKYNTAYGTLSIKEQEVLRCSADYYLLNESKNQCIIERDDYAGQRWVYTFFIGIGIFVVSYYVLKIQPEKEKHGKSPTRKDKWTNLNEAPSIDEVDEKKPEPKRSLNPKNLFNKINKKPIEKIPSFDEVEEK